MFRLKVKFTLEVWITLKLVVVRPAQWFSITVPGHRSVPGVTSRCAARLLNNELLYVFPHISPFNIQCWCAADLFEDLRVPFIKIWGYVCCKLKKVENHKVRLILGLLYQGMG